MLLTEVLTQRTATELRRNLSDRIDAVVSTYFKTTQSDRMKAIRAAWDKHQESSHYTNHWGVHGMWAEGSTKTHVSLTIQVAFPGITPAVFGSIRHLIRKTLAQHNARIRKGRTFALSAEMRPTPLLPEQDEPIFGADSLAWLHLEISRRPEKRPVDPQREIE